MEPSSSEGERAALPGSGRRSRRSRIEVGLDRVALGGLGLGLCLYVLPLGEGGWLMFGFWLTLVSTVLHIYTSHLERTPDH